uniref:hypothetical protein n=1 Tax=Streptomyces otsuchiensis TaxID=2681388 RepID=UPI00102FB8F7
TPAAARRLSVQALIVCVIALAAAVVAFAFMRVWWLGVIWVLLAGLTSNLAWYYHRTGREAAAPPAPEEDDAAAPGPGDRGTGAA